MANCWSEDDCLIDDLTLSMNLCVCVSGCDPELFENTLQLRERRLDLEELLVEEKKSAEALKKECDTLAKKVKPRFSSFGLLTCFCHHMLCFSQTSSHVFCCFFSALQEKTVKNNRKTVEDDLELVNREKQQKMNELDVVVPLRLHQVNSQKLMRKTKKNQTKEGFCSFYALNLQLEGRVSKSLFSLKLFPQTEGLQYHSSSARGVKTPLSLVQQTC